MIAAALIVATFVLCAALMVARRLPALLAVPLMALAFAAFAGAGPEGVASVLTGGAVRLAPVYATVIFGALLSRVTIATGIAETIVAYAAELGGDRPVVLALVLAATVAVLFTSLTGLGAIVMVGSIVLPILMTVGVPRKTAATLFLLAYALGYVFNLSQWAFYTTTFGVERPALQPYAYVLAAIDAVALVAFAAVQFRRTRGAAMWAVRLDDEPLAKPRVSLAALATPVLPIALALVCSRIPAVAYLANPIVAFALAALYGVLATQPREAIRLLTASAIRGVEDVAPAVLLFVGIGMLLVATALPGVQHALAPLVAAIAPRNGFAYVVVFGLLSPLALYRGPLNPYGVGIAIYTVLAGMHVLPAIVLVAAIMAVVQVQNACDPTNTQNVWVANFTGVHVDEILTATLPYQVAVATAATIVVALFGGPLIGASPASAIPPAAAATLPHVAPPRVGLPRVALSLDPNVSADATPAPTAAPSPFPASAAPSAVARSADAALAAAAAALTAGTLVGLEAPVSAKATFAIVAAPDDDSQAAATTIAEAIDRGWAGFRVVVLGAPERGDCRTRPYVAILRVAASTVQGEAGTTLASDLTLSDCADWPVAEWHDQTSALPEIDRRTVRTQALDTLSRLHLWTVDNRRSATHLFETGVADLGERPTFFYTLYKTTDGQMRVFVRAGGPAWAAGMRTNDVVEKLDGKYWWEYGTFQTQQRAYDGVAHVFVIQQQGADRTISLGAPYRG